MAYMKSSMISPLVENGDRPDSSITRGKHLWFFHQTSIHNSAARERHWTKCDLLKRRETDSSRSLPGQQCRDSGHLRPYGESMSPPRPTSGFSMVETWKPVVSDPMADFQLCRLILDITWLCGLLDPGGTRNHLFQSFSEGSCIKKVKSWRILPTLGWSTEMFHDPPLSEQETVVSCFFIQLKTVVPRNLFQLQR